MTEQQPYEVVATFPSFEIRRYPEHVVAEVAMEGSFERAGNVGFGPLVSYISGRNRTGTKVAMTAPVLLESEDALRHRVAFVMPAGSTVDSLPDPGTPYLSVHTVEEQLAAVCTYAGRWTEASFHARADALAAAVERAGFRVTGRPRFARFDPPWKPSFLRRNEVVLPVERG